MLDKFCWRWDLYKGAFLVGIFTLIADIACIAAIITLLVLHKSQNFEPKTLLLEKIGGIIFCFLLAIWSILLIVTLKKNFRHSPLFIAIWLFVYLSGMVVTGLWLISAALAYKYLLCGMCFLAFPIELYMWLIVYSYYDEKYLNIEEVNDEEQL